VTDELPLPAQGKRAAVPIANTSSGEPGPASPVAPLLAVAECVAAAGICLEAGGSAIVALGGVVSTLFSGFVVSWLTGWLMWCTVTGQLLTLVALASRRRRGCALGLVLMAAAALGEVTATVVTSHLIRGADTWLQSGTGLIVQLPVLAAVGLLVATPGYWPPASAPGASGTWWRWTSRVALPCGLASLALEIGASWLQTLYPDMVAPTQVLVLLVVVPATVWQYGATVGQHTPAWARILTTAVLMASRLPLSALRTYQITQAMSTVSTVAPGTATVTAGSMVLVNVISTAIRGMRMRRAAASARGRSR
jgi:hypothetical protein